MSTPSEPLVPRCYIVFDFSVPNELGFTMKQPGEQLCHDDEHCIPADVPKGPCVCGKIRGDKLD